MILENHKHTFSVKLLGIHLYCDTALQQ